MSTKEELVRAVLADPDSDAARRAFGTWMKTHPFPEGSETRGELVDVQLALAEVHRRHGRLQEWRPLYKRSEQLLASGGYLWRESLEPLIEEGILPDANPQQFAFEFRRGFVEYVKMDARTFAEHAPRVYAAAPIRDVELENVAAYPEALASPHLRQIAALSIVQQDLDDSAIELLASSPHASRLRMLEVPINRITMRGLEAICRSPHLRSVVWLQLRGNPVPNPVDEYDMEGEDIVDVRHTELGQELERRFGMLRWLHAPSYFGGPGPAFEAGADVPPAVPPVKGVGPEYEV